MKKIVVAFLAAFALIAVAATISLPSRDDAAEAAVRIPAPSIDVPATGGNQIAVLAGGCFWGMEGVFQHVDGVSSVVSGYAGGSAADANYRDVSAERTDHAEVVRIVYNPREVSYGRLLQIYFAVAHDPTQVNRQGPDTGRSYRSAIFPQTSRQREVAQRYIAELNRSDRFARPIATRIERGRFYRAEAYHQDFMDRNPRHPYILAHDVPKVRDFRRSFPNDYRAAAAD